MWNAIVLLLFVCGSSALMGPQRAPIVISPPTAENNVQVKVVIYWPILEQITSLDNGIAFTTTSGTLLPFWVEKHNPLESAVLWVKVMAKNTSMIHFYYGEGSLKTSMPNGANTFPLFEDFSGAALNTTKVNWLGNTQLQMGGHVTRTNSNWQPERSTMSFKSYPIVVEFDMRILSHTAGEVKIQTPMQKTSGAGSEFILHSYQPGDQVKYSVGNDLTWDRFATSTMVYGSSRWTKITHVYTTSGWEVYEDDMSLGVYTHTPCPAGYPCIDQVMQPISFMFNQGDMVIEQDNIRVRAYTMSLATIGRPETCQRLDARGACALCAAGTYFSTATSKCTPCPIGTYASGPGWYMCNVCAPGTRNGATGQLTCAKCAAGTVNSGGTTACTKCPPNTYANAADSVCLPCPPGHSSDAGSANRTMCMQCPAGTFKCADSTIGCAACTGKYSLVASAACVSCPHGMVGTVPPSDKCVPCPAGQYGGGPMAKCVNCPVGTTSSGGAFNVKNCDPIITVQQ